ncbi:MAG: DUF3830 family protein [Armatimonadota bacterium]|nr:DUF3830 family protein [Armatimonadota bacterium]MDR7531771.1 DUF3830 family protein [Armatimonadota bacterium]MDR7534884.1 DUF3830 family protein [Armatimonadota bacterium]
MRRIEVVLDDVTATAELLERDAPRTVERLWQLLPIHDRTIHVRWSGAAWRTEKNYPLQIGELENPVTWLEPGDIAYYDDPRYGLYKVAVCYGRSQWRDEKGELYVTRLGRIVDNLQPFIARCEQILYQGPKAVIIRPARGGEGGQEVDRR